MKTPLLKRTLFIVITTIILSISAYLRLSHLNEYPLSVNPDELTNIYDGYSISETGADRWGNKYPVILRGLGENDNRPPLYSWLAAGSIKLFGNSIASGRLPSAILGVISIILLLFVSNKIGGHTFSIITIVLACFSPWHLLLSRYALEGSTLPSFFIVLAIFSYIKFKETKSNWFLFALGLANGIAVNAYQSTKLIFFIITSLILIELFFLVKLKFTNIIYFGLVALLGAFPQIYVAFTMPERFFARLKGTIVEPSFSINYFQTIFNNFFVNLKPLFLFNSFGEYNYFTFGRLLSIEMLFFYFGIFVFLFKYKKALISSIQIFIIAFIVLLPSILTFDNPNAIRTAGVILLYPMFTAAGICFFTQFLKINALKYLYLTIILLLVGWVSISNILTYKNNVFMKNAGQQTILVDAFKKMNIYKNKYSKIYIYTLGHQAYLYVAYYSGITPSEFQKMDKYRMPGGWDYFKKLGKYQFINKEELELIDESSMKNGLLLSQQKLNKFQLIDSVQFQNECFFFYKNN